jgi:hypothetical protein
MFSNILICERSTSTYIWNFAKLFHAVGCVQINEGHLYPVLGWTIE